LEGDGELVVAEVLARLLQALMLLLCGSLMGTEVNGAGLELPALTFELVIDLLFFLLQVLLLPCHRQLPQGHDTHTPLKFLL
jgi:hypothetical protein